MPNLAGQRRTAVGAACALLLAAGLAALPGVRSGARAADPVVDPAGHPRPVKVMTRNLYLGADLAPAIEASTPAEVLAAGAAVFSVVQRTNFPERAVALAREVADADPVLLGLQEVAVWYSGPVGDPGPATTVEYDFLSILLQELAAAGAPYQVVGAQDEADIEAPAGAPYFRDFRLVQRDVVLVRAGADDDVRLSDARSGHFLAALPVPTGSGRVYLVKRGWVSVDAVVNGRSFRFVNTHLEAFHPLIRLAQAQELVAPGGPVGSAPGKVVLVGDLNSGPELPVLANRLAFLALVAARMDDTWRAAHPAHPGFTAGYSELLDDPSEAALEHRVDHVMTRGSVGLIDSRRYGVDPETRTVSGMWPSDHAGVMAMLLP